MHSGRWRIGRGDPQTAGLWRAHARLVAATKKRDTRARCEREPSHAPAAACRPAPPLTLPTPRTLFTHSPLTCLCPCSHRSAPAPRPPGGRAWPSRPPPARPTSRPPPRPPSSPWPPWPWPPPWRVRWRAPCTPSPGVEVRMGVAGAGGEAGEREQRATNPPHLSSSSTLSPLLFLFRNQRRRPLRGQLQGPDGHGPARQEAVQGPVPGDDL